MRKIYITIIIMIMLATVSFVAGRRLFAQTQNFVIQGVQDDSAIFPLIQSAIEQNLSSKSATRSKIVEILNSYGYYRPVIRIYDEIDKTIINIAVGKQYSWGRIRLNSNEDIKQSINISDFITRGDPAIASSLIEAQKEIYSYLQGLDNICYLELDIMHKALINHHNTSIAVTFDITAKDFSHFGDFSYKGQKRTKLYAIERYNEIKPGDCFKESKLNELKNELLKSGIFSNVEFELKQNKDTGLIDVEATITERQPRRVQTGLSYYTDEGVGINLNWEHVNFLGAGERVNANATVSEILKTINFDVTKPYFKRKDQRLSISTGVLDEDNDAYQERSFFGAALVSRDINDRLSISGGGAFDITRIEENFMDDDTYYLLSMPLLLTYDGRDDALNPHKGLYMSATAEPFYDINSNADPFLKTRATASTYLHLYEKIDTVLALRGSFGSIISDDNMNIPASKRFYAGGGGSIRGYSYKSAGPLDDAGDAIGGRSILEGSAELRYQLTDTYGGVFFWDVGNVYTKPLPNFSDSFLHSIGAGFRYFTDFGPIRFDIAIPLNKRFNDDNFQFYISIGQAF